MTRVSIQQTARSWRLPINDEFCTECGSHTTCVKLPFTDPEEGIVHQYFCLECADPLLEDD